VSLSGRRPWLSDLVDEGTEVGAAPTTDGCGAAGGAKGRLLTAVALEGNVGRMPLVGLAEWDFAGLVVRLDALEDLHHGLLRLSPTVSSAGRSCPAAGRWVGGCPEFRREAGSGPTLTRGVLLSRDMTILLSERDKVQGQMHRLSTA
jgi:hypothetical protein